MINSNTLLVRHMPSELTSEEKEDFLKHFGAVKVKIVGSKCKKSCNVYAVFETHKAAEAALKHLHQIEFLGRLLAVEFTRSDPAYDCDIDTSKGVKSLTDGSTEKGTYKYYENFLYRLNNWTSGLDFNVPPPVHLKYQYPPPTKSVLENIAKTMATVPKFYTQVLHLMNKMNLPCPFADPFPIETNILSAFDDTNKIINAEMGDNEISENKQQLNPLSEEESEIESDGDDESQINFSEIIPLKRTLPERKGKLKRPKFIKPAASVNVMQENKTVVKADEVFEKLSDKEPSTRKIEVKITPDLVSIQEAEETQKFIGAVEGFEKLPANVNVSQDADSKAEPNTEDDENVGSCITEQELAANRISVRDQRILPVFKNYQPGAPSCRLYVKNLAKQVTARDLHYIYRRYLITDREEEQGTMFDVRLMQEGRMKGQAFINLQSVEIAQKALKETNGFILKDKPMVVQFARSSKAKEK